MTETNTDTDELAWSLPELPSHRCAWTACRKPVVLAKGVWVHDNYAVVCDASRFAAAVLSGHDLDSYTGPKAQPGDPLVRMLPEQHRETEWLAARLKDARIDCGRFDRAADRVKLPKISNRLASAAALLAAGEAEARDALRFDDLLTRLAAR